MGGAPLDGRLVPQSKALKLHGKVAAKGKREESEKWTANHHQGGKHHPDGRRAYRVTPSPRALDTVLQRPDPPRPPMLPVFWERLLGPAAEDGWAPSHQ